MLNKHLDWERTYKTAAEDLDGNVSSSSFLNVSDSDVRPKISHTHSSISSSHTPNPPVPLPTHPLRRLLRLPRIFPETDINNNNTCLILIITISSSLHCTHTTRTSSSVSRSSCAKQSMSHGRGGLGVWIPAWAGSTLLLRRWKAPRWVWTRAWVRMRVQPAFCSHRQGLRSKANTRRGENDICTAFYTWSGWLQWMADMYVQNISCSKCKFSMSVYLYRELHRQPRCIVSGEEESVISSTLLWRFTLWGFLNTGPSLPYLYRVDALFRRSTTNRCWFSAVILKWLIPASASRPVDRQATVTPEYKGLVNIYFDLPFHDDDESEINFDSPESI